MEFFGGVFLGFLLFLCVIFGSLYMVTLLMDTADIMFHPAIGITALACDVVMAACVIYRKVRDRRRQKKDGTAAEDIMYCAAKYRGPENEFGLKPGGTYCIRLKAGGWLGSDLIWVEQGGENNYLMPYCSMGELLREWEFYPSDEDSRRQQYMLQRWVSTYIPAV